MKIYHTLIAAENEDTDPSEESSKSKSSPEERNSQGQGQRGRKMIQHSCLCPKENVLKTIVLAHVHSSSKLTMATL